MIALTTEYCFRSCIRRVANDWFRSYLSDRQQFVRLGNAESSSRVITCSIPQGSNLGPLLFLLFINDFPNSSQLFKFSLFADDSTLTVTFSKGHFDVTGTLNSELESINSWLNSNKIVINADKTKYINFAYRSSIQLDLIKIGGSRIKETESIKFLGVYLDKNLSFRSHINYISKKLSKSVGILNKLKHYLPLPIMKTLYVTFVQPYLQYCIEAWFAAYHNVTDKIVKIQKKVVRVVANAGYLDHTSILYKELMILKVSDLFTYQILIYMHKTINNSYDVDLRDDLVQHSESHSYATRNSYMYVIPRVFKFTSRHSIEYVGVKAWNSLPLCLRVITNLREFKRKLRVMFLDEY